MDFHWNLLYGQEKPKRISLPTYPFAKVRYWVPELSKGLKGESKIPEAQGKTQDHSALIEKEDIKILIYEERWVEHRAASIKDIEPTNYDYFYFGTNDEGNTRFCKILQENQPESRCIMIVKSETYERKGNYQFALKDQPKLHY